MIDTRLPLMVQQPNILAALDAGTQAAGNQANLMRQAEGQNIFRQYGAGAMQGDQNALAAIAGFDPVMAQGMDFDRQENARADARLGIARERLQIAREETARAVQEAQDKADAESQVRMMQRAFKAMDVGYRTGDMAAVTQGLSMFGLESLDPETGMQLAAQMVAGGMQGLAGAYLPKEDKGPLSPEGKLQSDIRAGYVDPNGATAVDPGAVDAFRKEFMGIPAFKDFEAQAQATARIMESALNPTEGGESDIALIFNYMKLLDPGSTVREGEFATASQVGGAAQQFVSLYNQLIDGSRLTQQQRAGFANAAQGLYSASEQRFMDSYRQFESIAQARGYPINQALIDPRYRGPMPEIAPPPPPPAPVATTPAPAPVSRGDRRRETSIPLPPGFAERPDVAPLLTDGLTAQDIWDNLSEEGKRKFTGQ